MKKTIYMMLAICASFVGMVHSRLEAASAIPEMLVVSCVRGAVNSVTLSTNTIGVSLDIDITDDGGNTEQLIGVIEWNATQQNPAGGAGSKMQISQLEDSNQIFDTLWGCFSGSCGDLSTSTAISNGTAVKIYSNVAQSSTDTYNYVSPTEVNNNPQNAADLTTSTTNTYCGQIGVLTFYAVDDADNSLDSGTYRGTFIIAIVDN